MTLIDIDRTTADHARTRDALRILSLDSAVTTGAVLDACAVVSERLRAKGVRAGDRVALVAGNSSASVIALMTLMHLDVSLVLLDARTDAAERARALGRAGVRTMVCDPSVPDTGPGVGRIELPDVVPAQAPAADGFELDLTAWERRDDALVVFSSGTMGEPTGVVRSGARVLANTDRTQRRMDYTADDVFLPLLPFSHQYGLSLVLLWWRTGGCLVLVPQTRLDHAAEAIERLTVTVVDAAPSTYHSLLNLLEKRKLPPSALSSVRLWCVGGAPLGPALARRFTAVTGRPLLDGYGSSECGNIALSSSANPTLCGTPLDGVTVDVLGPDGTPVNAGELGELVVTTPDLMTATLGPRGELCPVTDARYRTGDVGRRMATGEIAVLGRAGAVHRHGHTLYPEALARKAETAGARVHVLDVTDERRGCSLVFVVADPTRRDARYWRLALRPYLADHEQPNRVVVVDTFPTNRNGKVDVRALRAAVAEEGEDSGPGSVVGSVPVSASAPDASLIPLPDRIDRLVAVERFLEEHRDEVLEILTEVSNHRTAVGELESALETLRGAVAEISTYRPSVVDHTTIFMPSNIPLYGYVLYLLVPSLYSRTVTFRPSSHLRDQIERLHGLLADVHGLPVRMALSTQREFVTGPVASSDVVVFTGAYSNAEKIREQLRPDQLFVYFGQGVNPMVVGPDADVDHAVRDAIEIRLLNSGQDCFGPDVIYVHDSVAERFHGLLAKRIDELTFGDYADPDADYGAMYYEQAFGFALDHLHSNAEHIVHGGQVDLQSRRLEPTVLSRRIVTKKPRCEELFAPIFNVMSYSSDDELHTVLTSPFFEERAMGAMVYGSMPATVELLSKRHEVCRNTTLLETDNGNAPMGGQGMVANYIAHRGRRSAEPLLVSKAVADYVGTTEGRISA